MIKEKQLEIVKTILQNSNVNFLLGAGASYVSLDNQSSSWSYPLMNDLLEYVRNQNYIHDFYHTHATVLCCFFNFLLLVSLIF